MSEWTTPGLERRGKFKGRTYAALLVGCEVNWRTGRLEPAKPLQILVPPKVNNVEGAEPEWVTVDETHNWSPRAS